MSANPHNYGGHTPPAPASSVFRIPLSIMRALLDRRCPTCRGMVFWNQLPPGSSGEVGAFECLQCGRAAAIVMVDQPTIGAQAKSQNPVAVARREREGEA